MTLPKPPNIGDHPSAGHFKVKRVRGGPWVAVRIWLDDDRRDPDFPDLPLDRSPVWRAERDGREVDIEKVWPFAANHPIDVDEYRFLLADARHARLYRPGAPEAYPERTVDLGEMPSIF